MGAKIRFHPIDTVYKVRNNKTIVYTYGKTPDGERICITDENFEPYFYIKPKKDTDTSKLQKNLTNAKADNNGQEISIIKTETITKVLNGKKIELIKAITQIPKHVPILRKAVRNIEGVEETFEYDILYNYRYLRDKEIKPLLSANVEGEQTAELSRVPVFNASKIEPTLETNTTKINTLAFDIEVYNPRGKRVLPEKDPIIMLALYGQDYKKVLTWKKFKTKHDYIEFVDGEMQLLERFKEIIEQKKPDMITGYYSDGFDFPYIADRAKKYAVKLDMGLDRSELMINTRVGMSVAKITGITHIDLLRFIKTTMRVTLETDSLTLKNVSTELLGETKKEVDLNILAKVWDEKNEELLEEFCEYNLQDAKVTYDLFEKIWPSIEEMTKIVGLPPFDVSRMSFSNLVENYILGQMKKYDQLAPNKPNLSEKTARRKERSEGAYVYTPTPGIYENVAVFDFASLYPTIITSHNIGPDTLNCDCCQHDPVPGTKHRFCKKKNGFLPTIMEEIINRRTRIKELIRDDPDNKLLKARSGALKILANAFYGYLGYFNARWYCFPCVEAVTAYARHYIKNVIASAEKEGFKVIYGDTDSVFLTLKEKTEQQAQDFVDKINEDLPGLMELEYENFYPRGIFVATKSSEEGAKKRYAMLSRNGELKIRGFETVRRNFSVIGKEVQKKILTMILKDNDAKGAFKYAKEIIQELKDKKMSTDQLIIKTQLRKEIEDYDTIGPHVAIAKRMKARGEEVGAGTVVEYVVTPGSGPIRDRAKIPDEVKSGEYDADYYINNQIVPSIENIFLALGYEVKDAITGKKQSKLGEYF